MHADAPPLKVLMITMEKLYPKDNPGLLSFIIWGAHMPSHAPDISDMSLFPGKTLFALLLIAFVPPKHNNAKCFCMLFFGPCSQQIELIVLPYFGNSLVNMSLRIWPKLVSHIIFLMGKESAEPAGICWLTGSCTLFTETESSLTHCLFSS